MADLDVAIKESYNKFWEVIPLKCESLGEARHDNNP